MASRGPERNSAQAEATRQIAEQLFTVWEAEREREAKESRRWFGGNVGGWLTAVVIVIGAVVAMSNTHVLAASADTRSLQNEARITEMKVENSDRLGRIETKIDIMLKERGR